MTSQARDIVLLGGSAGGIDAVAVILAAFPRDFAGSTFVALHREPRPSNLHGLTELFSSRTMLHTHSAQDQQPIESGNVYIGPPDRHMLLANGLIRLEQSPREHRFRPCVDVLFKSAAFHYGRRVIGVLLSGLMGNDGAAGLWQIRQRGGVTIVQDPRDAKFPGMPQSAIDCVDVDYVLPLVGIGPQLADLVSSRHPVVAAPLRILVVEDERIIALNLEENLTGMGYLVDQVTSGEAAIEMAHRTSPDLILMDIRLAGALSGTEAARRIWQKRQIPVVFCTAHADGETLRAVQATESYGFLLKPFEPPALRAAIELAVARREQELR